MLNNMCESFAPVLTARFCSCELCFFLCSVGILDVLNLLGLRRTYCIVLVLSRSACGLCSGFRLEIIVLSSSYVYICNLRNTTTDDKTPNLKLKDATL